MFVNDLQYTQDFLKKRFSFSFFKEKTLRIGNIISFISPSYIKNEKVENCLNFCCEIPDISIHTGIALQKLFIINVANYLSSSVIKEPIQVINDQMILKKEFINNGIIHLQGVININDRNYIQNSYLYYLGIIISLGNENLSYKYVNSGLEFNSNLNEIIHEIEKIYYQLNSTIFLESYQFS